jgi:hypothetical protein
MFVVEADNAPAPLRCEDGGSREPTGCVKGSSPLRSAGIPSGNAGTVVVLYRSNTVALCAMPSHSASSNQRKSSFAHSNAVVGGALGAWWQHHGIAACNVWNDVPASRISQHVHRVHDYRARKQHKFPELGPNHNTVRYTTGLYTFVTMSLDAHSVSALCCLKWNF